MRNEKHCFTIRKFFVSCTLPNKKIILLFIFICAGFLSFSQAVLSPKKLKKLSMEELMNIQVTLVSRTPEKLSEAASAIQVITGEDIRRSGATNIPEALRLVANLQVAQFNSSIWIISSRGFNTTFANKLLVMIDGRNVYTPLYGGVLWEQQYPLLEDIERIEIVSGPGGTLWGANAVNGVINIVTKNSKQTQGLYAEAGIGNLLKDQVALRYGGAINDKVHYRVYAQHFNRDTTSLAGGASNHDAWHLTEAGFRIDWDPSKQEAVSIQGDYYWGNKKTFVGTELKRSPINGQNILARWTKTFSNKSDISLQVYYDRYYRDDEPSFSFDKETTLDADLQHHFTIGDRQSIVWGLGYRYVKDDDYFDVTKTFAGIFPEFKRLDLANAFVQDEVRLVDSLKLIVGTKLLHNVYTGWEWQPSVRLSYIKRNNTLWAALSRAVRTPSRLDVDYYLPPPPQNPNTLHIFGDPNFQSEKVIAYEVGYRLAPNHASFFSISAFYNVYHDVYSVELEPAIHAYVIQNGSEGRSEGLEFAGGYQINRSWRLRAGYTYFDKYLHQKPGHIFNPDYLGNDARHQVVLQSISDLSPHFQFDIAARYISGLDSTFATLKHDPAYFTFDARIAYTFKGFELSVIGQNLATKEHLEYASTEIPRAVFVKLAARF